VKQIKLLIPSTVTDWIGKPPNPNTQDFVWRVPPRIFPVIIKRKHLKFFTIWFRFFIMLSKKNKKRRIFKIFGIVILEISNNKFSLFFIIPKIKNALTMSK
jgi:hypothetical protein